MIISEIKTATIQFGTTTLTHKNMRINYATTSSKRQFVFGTKAIIIQQNTQVKEAAI